MFLDIECPVEVKEITIKRSKKRNMTYCECIFYNLAQKSVCSIKFTIRCLDSFGEEVSVQGSNEVVVTWQELHVASKQSFGKENLIPLPEHPETRDGEIVITEVLFSDKTVWKKGTNELVNVSIDKIEDRKELQYMQTAAGNDAICYPKIQKDIWICICGRANRNDSKICLRCNRKLEYITEQFSDKAAVEKKIYELEEQKREEERQKLEKERLRKEEQHRKKLLEEVERQEEIKKQTELLAVKKKKRKKIFIAVACVVVIGIVSIFVIRAVMRAQTYNQAMKYMNNKQFDKSLDDFNKVLDYKDTKEQIKELHYQYALNLLNHKKYEKALVELKNIVDYKDSKEKIKEVYYQQLIYYIKMRQWLEAKNLISHVQGYKNVSALNGYITAKTSMPLNEDASGYKRILDILKTIKHESAGEFKAEIALFEKEVKDKYDALLAKQEEQRQKELAEKRKKEAASSTYIRLVGGRDGDWLYAHYGEVFRIIEFKGQSAVIVSYDGKSKEISQEDYEVVERNLTIIKYQGKMYVGFYDEDGIMSIDFTEESQPIYDGNYKIVRQGIIN